jgi:hypothetical protein
MKIRSKASARLLRKVFSFPQICCKRPPLEAVSMPALPAEDQALYTGRA